MSQAQLIRFNCAWGPNETRLHPAELMTAGIAPTESSSCGRDVTRQLAAAESEAGHRCQKNYQSLTPTANKHKRFPSHVQPEDGKGIHLGHVILVLKSEGNC
ncbi:unnamed protein product [Leuciscus chuanchicus]